MSALFFARLISGRFTIIREPLVSRASRYMAVVALTLCVPSIHLAALSSKSAFSFPHLMPVILWPSLDPTTLSGWGYGTGKPASQPARYDSPAHSIALVHLNISSLFENFSFYILSATDNNSSACACSLLHISWSSPRLMSDGDCEAQK